MRFFKHNTFWVGIVYFLILLSIAFWVRDIPNQQDSFNTIQQLINAGGMSDSASFATAAIDVAENGWISSANEWVFNLWPPGFVLLEALILKVFGLGVPIILVLQILAAALFAIVLTLLHDFLRTLVKSRLAVMLPLLIFAFPVSRVFLLEPGGVVLGESFAIGFFLLGVLLILRSVMKNSLRCAVYAGLCLALTAYFRSQFELILLALTGWGVLLVIVIQFTRLRNLTEPSAVKFIVKTIAITLLVAHAATAPWRVYHMVHLHYNAKIQKFEGSPSWVYTSQLIYENSVQTTEYLYKNSGGFVVAGAGNLTCRIDPATCGDTANAQKSFIKTFIKHPVEWYSFKFEVIGKYWFSSMKNRTHFKFSPTVADTLINGLLLMSLIALVCLLFTRKVRSHGSWILLMWFNASLISAYMLIFTLVHFEVRYFYFPKIAIMLMFIIVSSMYYQPMKNVGINNN
jgi:hypothetical protein